jgi:hypothetical protein
LIPPTDFCFPAEMTNELSVIKGCADVYQESDCVKGCNWYKGSGDFSKYGKCEPLATTLVAADKEACLASTDPKACDPTKCVYVPITTPAPAGTCAPLAASDTLALKAICYAATDAATCPPANCIW